MSSKWDFSGWATKSGIKCSDGRTIRKGAFKDCNGKVVPLVWNHNHSDVSEVLGHALLEDRDGDMYAYCSFNNTTKGREAKQIVEHGDIVSLSIYANNLQQSSKRPPCDVIHGVIREVSLVLAGANPGAFIENVGFAHGDDANEEEAIIYHDDDDFKFYHADKDKDEDNEEETEEEADEESEDEESDDDEDDDSDDKEKKKLLEAALKHMKNKKLAHADSDDEPEKKEKTVEDMLNDLDEEHRNFVYGLIGKALDGKNSNDNKEEEDSTMRHNVFDTDSTVDQGYLLHSEDYKTIFDNAKRLGSLKDAVNEFIEENSLEHAEDSHGNTVTYGIADIDYLFPDAKNLNVPPEFISRNMDWVKKVINGTHHTPFSRVKSMFADITEDEARAKGYLKGKQKKEEVFTLLKRETTPQTIYKMQKLDRDDIIDITDFDVVAWIKGEMRMMLEEEIARAILIGDGRSTSSNDHIRETNIRPVYNDEDLFTVKYPVKVAANATEEEKAEALMDAAIRARKLYKGTGNPTFFTTEDELTEMLLLKDKMGHKFYKTEGEVATALRAKEVVTVEVMEGQKIGIKVGETTTQHDLAAVMVNLADYNVGADKGGQTQLFDDFDIDFNQFKYLLETRMSGALTKPYSAVSFYYEVEE